jgi:hypothetical protein
LGFFILIAPATNCSGIPTGRLVLQTLYKTQQGR